MQPQPTDDELRTFAEELRSDVTAFVEDQVIVTDAVQRQRDLWLMLYRI